MKPGTSGVNAVSIILKHQNRASTLYNKSLEKKRPCGGKKISDVARGTRLLQKMWGDFFPIMLCHLVLLAEFHHVEALCITQGLSFRKKVLSYNKTERKKKSKKEYDRPQKELSSHFSIA